MRIVFISMRKHCTMSNVLLFCTYKWCVCWMRVIILYAFDSVIHNLINTFSLIKWKFYQFSLLVQWPRLNGKKRATTNKECLAKMKLSGSRYEFNCRHFHLLFSNFTRTINAIRRNEQKTAIIWNIESGVKDHLMYSIQIGAQFFPICFLWTLYWITGANGLIWV